MKKILLILIFFLGLALRVYKLGNYPQGLTWDEAALGYNAYSILKTAKDEYGQFLPLIFKSFGDYKPGLYVYLTVPSVLIFGLNEAAVRLPSALAGILMIYVLYCLVEENFAKDRKWLGILTAFVLATNPWLIHFSRGAWEANLALLEVILGAWLFLKFIKTENKLDGLYSSLFFGLTFLTYQGAKAFTSVLILGLGLFWFKGLKKIFSKKNKFIILPLAICFLFVTLGALSGKAGGRIKVMSLFSYHRPAEEIQEIRAEGGGSERFFFPIFHNENFYFLEGFLSRYFNYFSARFLFFEGDWSSQRHGPPYSGTLLLVALPFLILGLFRQFSKKRSQLENFLLFWLLVAPIPAALTRDSIQAIRSLPMAVPLIFLTALGVDHFFSLIKSGRLLVLAKLGVILFFSLNLVNFLDLYFIHYPIYSAKDWGYGYKDVSQMIGQKMGNYDRVVMTQKYGQPYIFFLFYNQYDPQRFQKQANLIENASGDVGQIQKIDNLEFREIYWPADRGLSNSLFIGTEFELPLQDLNDSEKYQILKEIRYPDKSIAFRVVQSK